MQQITGKVSVDTRPNTNYEGRFDEQRDLYRITHTDDEKDVYRHVIVHTAPLAEFENWAPELYKALKETGFSRKDKVAWLERFYPNGDGEAKDDGNAVERLVASRTRDGTGTAVLNYVMQDTMQRRDAVALFGAYQASRSQRQFLAKKGFQEANPGKYKIIQQPQPTTIKKWLAKLHL